MDAVHEHNELRSLAFQGDRGLVAFDVVINVPAVRLTDCLEFASVRNQA